MRTKEEIEKDIASLKVKQAELEAELVATSGFVAGQILNVHFGAQGALLGQGIYKASHYQYGKVKHIVAKIKKDGKASAQNWYDTYTFKAVD